MNLMFTRQFLPRLDTISFTVRSLLQGKRDICSKELKNKKEEKRHFKEQETEKALQLFEELEKRNNKRTTDHLPNDSQFTKHARSNASASTSTFVQHEDQMEIDDASVLNNDQYNIEIDEAEPSFEHLEGIPEYECTDFEDAVEDLHLETEESGKEEEITS